MDASFPIFPPSQVGSFPAAAFGVFLGGDLTGQRLSTYSGSRNAGLRRAVIPEKMVTH